MNVTRPEAYVNIAPSRRREINALATSFFLLPLLLIVPNVVRGQAACERVLSEAEAHYVTGSFTDAINILAPCVRSFPAGSDEDRAAHRLLALAYLRNGEIEESRLVIVELFERNPDYEADPVSDPPAYVSMVNLVREESGVGSSTVSGGGAGGAAPPRTWLRSPRTWLIVAGSSAVVATLLVLGASGGGGNGSDALPLPPAFP